MTTEKNRIQIISIPFSTENIRISSCFARDKQYIYGKEKYPIQIKYLTFLITENNQFHFCSPYTALQPIRLLTQVECIHPT